MMTDPQAELSDRPAAEPGQDVGARLSRLTELVESLGEIVTRETELLATRHPRSLADTQSEKELLAAAYEYELRHLKADPGWVDGADPAAVGRLKQAVECFDAIMGQHARRLVTVKSISEGMIQAIAEEVQRKRQPVTGYDRNAMLGPVGNGGYGIARTAPLTLNQTI